MSPRDLAVEELESNWMLSLSFFAPIVGLPTYIWLASSPSCAIVGILDTPPHCFTAPAQ